MGRAAVADAASTVDVFDRLIDAAYHLFSTEGIEPTSIDRITEHAGYSRGAFYSNFDSKDELGLDVLRRKGEQYLSAMQAAIAVIPDEPGTTDGTERLIRDAVGVFLEA